MSDNHSSKLKTSQIESSFREDVGARLQEERQRIEPHQGRFAEKIGLTSTKQSFLETGYNQLRAEYLCQIHKLGLDIIYILTGERTESVTFDSATSRLITNFVKLPDGMKKAVSDLAETLAAQDVGDKPPARDRERASDYATLHSPTLGYHGEEKR